MTQGPLQRERAPGVERDAPVALALTAITKRYPGVVALDRVSLEVRAGEIHALVGENGAGKSTLIGVASGSVAADDGTVEIGGVQLTKPDAAAAQALGIAVVYQHPAVLPDMTVVENLVLGAASSQRPQAGNRAAWARQRLDRVGGKISPYARVCDLSPAGRHFVELARAVALQPKVLILDEPTEPFSSGEVEALFTLLEQMRADGCCIVYISHRLPDVRSISKRLTVLRDGRVQGTFDTAAVSESELVDLIVGGHLEEQFPPKNQPVPSGEAAPGGLHVKINSARVHDVELAVAVGEIFGLAGIEGNGQRDIVRGLAGVVPGSHGSATWNGARIRFNNPAAARRSGLSHIPADRHTEGLFGPASVRENISLLRLRTFSRFGFVRPRAERSLVAALSDRFRIKAPSMQAPVAALSGGNQQKVLVGRAISASPRVLLADEPTAGVDVGSRAEIYSELREAAQEGSSVVVTSSDAAELAGLCDRVAVLSAGKVVRVLAGEDVTEDRIVGTAVAASPDRAEHREIVMQGHLRHFLAGDYLPAAVLAGLAVLLIAATAAKSGYFLGTRNLSPLMSQIAILGIAAVAQAVVLMAGAVDLSVGPLMGLTTVVASFILPAASSPGQIIVGIALLVVLGLVVGLVNGALVLSTGTTSIVATLITYIALQGVSLALRPTAAGTFSITLSDFLGRGIGPVPLTFIAAVVIVIAAEYALRRSRWGLRLRAVGSDELASLRLTGRTTRTHLGAFLLCSLISVVAGLLLAAQNQIGDPSSGTSYTLVSITAVVLGGAKLAGGRGSFVGAFAGAVVLELVLSATTFFNLSVAWQVAIPGMVIIASSALYSVVRTVRRAR